MLATPKTHRPCGLDLVLVSFATMHEQCASLHDARTKAAFFFHCASCESIRITQFGIGHLGTVEVTRDADSTEHRICYEFLTLREVA